MTPQSHEIWITTVRMTSRRLVMKIFTLEKESRLKTRNYTFELQKRKNNTSTKTQKLRSTSLKLQSIFISFFLLPRDCGNGKSALCGWRREKIVLNAFLWLRSFLFEGEFFYSTTNFYAWREHLWWSLCGGISRTLSNTLWITCILVYWKNHLK